MNDIFLLPFTLYYWWFELIKSYTDDINAIRRCQNIERKRTDHIEAALIKEGML